MAIVVRNDGSVDDVVLPQNIKRVVKTEAALGHGEAITVGPFATDGYGKISVMVDADQDGTFDVTEHASDTSAAIKTPISAQATVGSTYYEGTPVAINQPFAAVVWTNGHVTDDAAVTVTVLLEGTAGDAEIVPYDSAGVELFSDANPGSVQLRTADGAVLGSAADPLPVGLTTAAGAAIGEAGAAPLFTEVVDSAGVEVFSDANPASVQLRTAAGDAVGTAADPLPVGLTTAAGAAIGEAAGAPLFAEVVDGAGAEVFTDANPASVQLRTAAGDALGTAADPLPVGLTTAAGAAIGEAAAAPLMAELVNSSAAELFTTTTPGQVEALITDGAGTAVSQSVSTDYATITVWEVAAQAVTQAATYTGTGRDCLYMKDIAVSAHATQASSADGCLVQESNDKSTWYTLSKCTLAASTNTILYAGPRTRRYVRILYTEGDTGAAVLNTSISASPQ